MDYKKKDYKYLYNKYKSKYLNLKQQGGSLKQQIDNILSGEKPYNFENIDFKDEAYNFEGKDLTSANFKGIKGTKYVRFNEAILDQANFEGAELPPTERFGAKSVKGISFKDVDFKDDNFNLRNKDLTSANFKGIKGTKYVRFNDSILDQANFEGAELPPTERFEAKSVKGISFKDVDFKNDNFNLRNKDLTGANFKGIKGTKYVRFNDSILDQANFEGAELPPVERFGAKSAKGINFTGVDFKNESYNFRGIDLTDAIFEGVKNTNYMRKN